MRIAVISCHTPSLFWFRLDMMKEFLKRGHKVFAFGNESSKLWNKKFRTNGIIYKQINVIRNSTNPAKDLLTLKSIKKALVEIKPDKLFTYQAKTVIYGGIAANQLGITEVYPLIAGLGSIFLNESTKTKIIRKILMTEYKIAIKNSPKVFFQNSDDEKTFRDYGVINYQKTVKLNGSGVNLEKFTIQPLPDTPAFLCISRLIKDKGIYEYLEACKKIKKDHPTIRCMLVGPFDSNPSSLQPEELQEYIDTGIIEYYGEQTDVLPYLAQCTVYVLPSYREGTPKTVLEAMAAGRAVITTDAPGCRETVDNEINGLLVPVKDVESLTAAMKRLISDKSLQEFMAKNSRIKAEALFDVNRINHIICESMQI